MPLDDDDAAALADLAAEAEIGRAGWVRGAIRTAADDPRIARRIARHADQTAWGGRREGAGRRPRITEES